ncbi:CBM6-containing protein, partial [Lasiosphaeris hirsuta]
MTTLEDALYNQKKYGILQAPTANNGNGTTIHSTTTANQLEITLQNNTNAGVVYGYVTGLDIDRNNAVFVLRSDGVTRYYPGSPGNDGSSLPEDCHIKLNGPGQNRRVTIPRLVGGRVWFCRDDKLAFLLNRGPALVQPSVMNRSDPNYNKDWGFAEFTFNSFQIFANITYVDFVGLPISLALTSRNGGQAQKVTGIPENGLSSICSELIEQNNRDRAGWDQLVIKSPRGTPLRALSPNSGINMNETLFGNYYQPYVNAVWAKYSSSALTLNTQGQWGVLKGQISNGRLSFNVGSFPQPSAKDVFSCDSGAFTNKNDAMGNVTARLAAAFNRSTLLTNTNQPDGETIGSYYRDNITNHYSRIVHKYNSDGRGYAFPYDDVAPSDRENVAGTVADQNPGEFVVAVGG